VEPAWKHWTLACAMAVLGGATVGAVHSDKGDPTQTVLPAPTRPYDSAPGQLPSPQENLDQVAHRPPVVRAGGTGQQPKTRATVRRSEPSEPDDNGGSGKHGEDGRGNDAHDTDDHDTDTDAHDTDAHDTDAHGNSGKGGRSGPG
jgi:hypothetical protein